MNAVISKVDQAGRISVSAQQRRASGLENGTPIVISVVGNELRIRSVHVAMAELQTESERFLQNEAASVDAFIVQRRADVDGQEGVVPGTDEPPQIDEPEGSTDPGSGR